MQPVSFFAWDVSTILFVILVVFFITVTIFRLFILKIDKPKLSFAQKIFCYIRYILFLNFYKTDSDAGKPKIYQWARSFYPVILLVFVLRSFLLEPFQIPSNSMMPTLLTGDFILVNKFIYGVKLPVTNTKIFPISEPKRGDIIVFRYPNYENNPQRQGDDYIKRVVGLPGDRIRYVKDKLYINEKIVPKKFTNYYQGVESGRDMTGFAKFRENISNSKSYDILVSQGGSKEYRGVVPEGTYFVLGDNRSRSADSRFWGFVPQELLIGQAFFIWFHYDESLKFGRLGLID